MYIHYNDVIMGMIASQITSFTIVYSTFYSDADQRKHLSSASLAFVQGIHRGSVNSPHKWSVTRKMFPFDDVIMRSICYQPFVVSHFIFKMWVCRLVTRELGVGQNMFLTSHVRNTILLTFCFAYESFIQLFAKLMSFHLKGIEPAMNHNNDVIMGMMASQITNLAIFYSTVYSDADQRKHKSSASLAFVRGIHRWRGALMFSFICAWKNGWVNIREAGDLRRHRTHYDVIVMNLGEELYEGSTSLIRSCHQIYCWNWAANPLPLADLQNRKHKLTWRVRQERWNIATDALILMQW